MDYILQHLLGHVQLFELQPKKNGKYLRVFIKACHAQLSSSKQGSVKILERQCGRVRRSLGARGVV